MKIRNLIGAVAILTLAFNTVSAQIEGRGRYQFFNNDSLRGFDEDAARRSAISEGFVGQEFPVRMNILKRRYINDKFNLVRPVSPAPAFRGRPVPGCVNEDFEASTAAQITTSNQITGWVVTGGSHSQSSYNSCNLLGCCPGPPVESELITAPSTGYVDNTIGAQYPIYSVFGTSSGNSSAAAAANPQITQQMKGDNFIRINSSLNNLSIVRLTKTFAITAQNALFQFAFISVFATGHTCCDAGAFKINLFQGSQVLPCPNFTVSAPSGGSGGCPATSGTPDYFVAGSNTTYTFNNSGSNGYIIYNKWKINSIDFSSYIGQNITIDIVASDCTAGGHYGYIYFDAQCGPMTLTGNSIPFPAGSPSITVPTCGAAGATVCAPSGLGPYWWQGANINQNSPLATPAFSNQCFVSNVTATYTLFMQPAGSCSVISKAVTTTVTPAPLLAASVVQAHCGDTMAIVSVTPSGSAAQPSSLTWSPNPFSLNSATTVGQYHVPVGLNPPPIHVTVTATDPLGCFVTSTVNVMPAPPMPSFTFQNLSGQYSITCSVPVVTLVAANNYTYGTLNYFWQTPTTTYSSQSADITTAGNITVTISDPVTNCVLTKTTAVMVNTTAPTGSVSPTFMTINCTNLAPTTVTATAVTPSINVVHAFYDPLGGFQTFTATSAAIVPIAGPGTYTDIIINQINGCTTVKTFSVFSNDGFPTFSLSSSPAGFTVGCGAKATVTITQVNGQTNPPGGSLNYSLDTPTGPNGGGGPAYSLTLAGTYTANLKANNGCVTRVQFSILDNKFGPGIDTIYTPRLVVDCTNPRSTLRAFTNKQNLSYSWNYPGGQVQSDSIVVSSNTAAPTTSLLATYTITVVDNNNLCPTTKTVPIVQNLYPPNAAITPPTSSLSCYVLKQLLTNGSKSTIPPNTFPIFGTRAVHWTGPSPQPPVDSSSTYDAFVPGTYTVMVMDVSNGCQSTATANVIDNIIAPVLNNPVVPPTATLDCGSKTASLTPLVTTSTVGLKYVWTTLDPPQGGPVSATLTGAHTRTLFTNAIGKYHVRVTDTLNGCASETDMSVDLGSLVTSFTADVNEGFAPLLVTFSNTSASSLGSSSVVTIWNFGNSNTATISAATSATQKETVMLYNQPGNYTVTMWASKGDCIGKAQMVVKVEVPSELTVPNIFTPNGDGVNDLFFLKATNLSNINFIVFDRWGHKIYELDTEKGNIAWDGKNQQGKEVAEGVYFYVLKATGKDGQTYDKKGNITVVR